MKSTESDQNSKGWARGVYTQRTWQEQIQISSILSSLLAHARVLYYSLLRAAKEYLDGHLLEAVQPSFRPAHECSSNGSPDEAKSHKDSLARQGPVDFGTAQNALFSLIILKILLAVLVSYCQSCMGQMWSFLESLLFLKIFPWNSLGTDT